MQNECMTIQKTLFSALAACAFVAASATYCLAQAVRGVVVDATDRPVPGVVVFMVDTSSTVVARGLTGERGEFRVAAARAGTYRLRTMRIGYRPMTSDPIVLLLGGESEKRVAISSAQLTLDTVRVTDRNSCHVANDQAAASTYAALDQARTALSAAQLTLSGRNIRATTAAYDRTLDADGKRVIKQSSGTTTAYVTQPWRAISPDSAHRAGFIFIADDGSTTYFAPSIDVLLSNVFVEDHCFRLVADRKESDLVGVAFEPSSERTKIAEVRGTLWIDRKTAELRRLDYRYVNLPQERDNGDPGGEVTFARLKNGGWVMSRWDIRMPVLERQFRDEALGGNRVRLAAVQLAGGEIQLVTRANGSVLDTLWSRPGLTLVGFVLDSARGTPIPNAHVDLSGAARSGVTDGDGRFSIHDVLPGTYTVETLTPELEAIGAVNQSTIAFGDSTSSYHIRVPNASQLVTALCAGRTLGSREAVIVGRVYQVDDTSRAVGVRVVAEWTEAPVGDDRGAVGERTGKKMEARTSGDGAYRFCGVPANTVITLSALGVKASSQPKSVFTGTRVARADLTADRAVRVTGRFIGKVLIDSTKTPIGDAEIYFPELSKVGRSGIDGSFEIADIPAGEQHVVIRHIGYGVLDTKLAFAANSTLDRQVFLSRAALLDSVVVTDRATLNILRDFEDNRRVGLGHFLDRSELAKQTPDTKIGRLMSQWPGVTVFGSGGHMYVVGNRKGPPLCMPNAPASCFESQGYYVPRLGDPSGVRRDCYSQIYIDGVLMNHGNPTPYFDLGATYADQAEAVEWYAGPSETPGRYSNLNAVCGVLVIHTRRTP
jgi:hypothetical protein